jgi:hypothetical protein
MDKLSASAFELEIHSKSEGQSMNKLTPEAPYGFLEALVHVSPTDLKLKPPKEMSKYLQRG